MISIALFLLILVLEGPIDFYAEEMFFIHMIQHLTLMVIIAPLLLSANAMPIFIWGTPKKIRSVLSKPFAGNSFSKKILTIITRPRYSLLLYVLNLYLWHIPFFYNLTLSLTDSTGMQTKYNFTLNVLSSNPTPSITSPTAHFEGNSNTFTLTASASQTTSGNCNYSAEFTKFIPFVNSTYTARGFKFKSFTFSDETRHTAAAPSLKLLALPAVIDPSFSNTAFKESSFS